MNQSKKPSVIIQQPLMLSAEEKHKLDELFIDLKNLQEQSAKTKWTWGVPLYEIDSIPLYDKVMHFQHPEQQVDEIFISNVPKNESSSTKWKFVRKGNRAYNYHGVLLKNHAPVFVKRHEIQTALDNTDDEDTKKRYRGTLERGTALPEDYVNQPAAVNEETANLQLGDISFFGLRDNSSSLSPEFLSSLMTSPEKTSDHLTKEQVIQRLLDILKADLIKLSNDDLGDTANTGMFLNFDSGMKHLGGGKFGLQTPSPAECCVFSRNTLKSRVSYKEEGMDFTDWKARLEGIKNLASGQKVIIVDLKTGKEEEGIVKYITIHEDHDTMKEVGREVILMDGSEFDSYGSECGSSRCIKI